MYTRGITTLAVVVGSSSCLGVTAGPGVVSQWLTWGAGSSVYLLGSSLIQQGFGIGAALPATVISGPAPFFLAATTGTTTTVFLMKQLSGITNL